MAYYIKSIPTLTGDVAQRFNERAAEAEANCGAIDFTEQVEVAHNILAEAHLSYLLILFCLLFPFWGGHVLITLRLCVSVYQI